MSIKSIISAACIYLAVVSFNANATPIQFGFEGYITYSELVEGPNVGESIPGAPSANTLISGHYIFEAPSPDKNADDAFGHYDNLISLTVNIGALTYEFTDTNPYAGGHIEVDNNTGTLFTRDKYVVTVSGNSSFDVFTGPSIGDFRLFNFSLSLFDWGTDTDPDLIQDDSLPLLPPDLGLLTDAYNFGNNATTEIVFSYTDGTTRGKLRGEVTSLSAVPVPEPPMFLLVISGLIGVVGFARRKKA